MLKRFAAAVLVTGALATGVGGVASAATTDSGSAPTTSTKPGPTTSTAPSTTTAPGTTTAPHSTGGSTTTTPKTGTKSHKSKKNTSSSPRARARALWVVLAHKIKGCKRAPKRLKRIEKALAASKVHLAHRQAGLKHATANANTPAGASPAGGSAAGANSKATQRAAHHVRHVSRAVKRLEKMQARAVREMSRLEGRCHVAAPAA